MRQSLCIFTVGAAGLLGGCSAMEQYHFPQTQDKVTVPAILAFSEAHPNDVITAIAEQKMYDGHTRYTITTTNTKNQVKTVVVTAEGKIVENPL